MNKKNILMNILIIVTMGLSYLVVDLGIRYIDHGSDGYYIYTDLAPTLFSLGWISIFIFLFYFLSKRIRRYFYVVSLVIFNLIGYSEYLHFKILGRFYGISDLFLVGEGSSYFKYAVMSSDIKILIIMFISILLGLFVFIFSKKYHEMYRDKMYFIFIILFSCLCCSGFFVCAHFRLGESEKESSYDASINPVVVYNDFNNPSKNIQVTGMYESVFRGLYVYIRNSFFKDDEMDVSYIKDYVKENNKELIANDYTGIFKNKNVIFILMESIDDFVVTEEYMPTLYRLQNEGFNFKNRYSPTFGGGATINSEFAVNTGLYTSLDNNIYNLNNTYRTSLANSFKKEGYSVISIHHNYGDYYNRTLFHENLGYDKHYALLDMDDIDKDRFDYGFDTNLIKSDKVYDLIVRDNKFLSFITTYSAHLPYDGSNERCNNKYGFTSTDSAMACIRNLVYDTDEMIRLLIERLKEDNKLDNTVLVMVSDHYMYGYSNVNKKKKIDNKYLLQHTPFIIWGSNINHVDVDNMVDTADILPTVLNLFGISYDPNYYVGEDAFSNDRDNYIYFSSDDYFDGEKLYSANNGNGDKKIYDDIDKKIRFNNSLIDSNYLKLK